MEETIGIRKSGFDITSRSTFSKEDGKFSSCSFAALLAKSITPYSHKKVADKKGLSVVVDKNTVVYGGLDITDEVSKALQSGK